MKEKSIECHFKRMGKSLESLLIIKFECLVSYLLSICDIGNITFCLPMAKYLPILPRGETVQKQTEKFHSSQYEITKCQ